MVILIIIIILIIITILIILVIIIIVKPATWVLGLESWKLWEDNG